MRYHVVFVLFVLITSMFVGALIVHNVAASGLKVESIQDLGNPFQINGYVTEMSVTVSYYGEPSTIPVAFRIFANTTATNSNGLLWVTTGDSDINSGQTTTFVIVPRLYIDLLPIHSYFIVEAYYGDYQGVLSSTVDQVNEAPISNPTFSYFAPYQGIAPGWQLTHSQGSTINITQPNLNSIALSIMPQKGNAVLGLTQYINFSDLIQSSMVMKYSITTPSQYNAVIDSDGNVEEFAGVEIALNNGTQTIYFGYNQTTETLVFNHNSVIVLSSNSIINFGDVKAIIEMMKWQMPAQAQISLLFIVTNPQSTETVTFSNITVS